MYQATLEREFPLQKIPLEREVRLPVSYRGDRTAEYPADFVCYGTVIVELKALQKLTGVGQTQVINYLKVTGCNTGLLLNSGAPIYQHKRFVFNLREST